MASSPTAEVCDANPSLLSKGELRVLPRSDPQGNLGLLAHNMGWAGIIVNGCIRDVDEINGCDIGVGALGSNFMKSNKKGIGEKHAPANIGGLMVQEGEWQYADSDGILISKMESSI